MNITVGENIKKLRNQKVLDKRNGIIHQQQHITNIRILMMKWVIGLLGLHIL